jgi:hypothetical protein
MRDYINDGNAYVKSIDNQIRLAQEHYAGMDLSNPADRTKADAYMNSLYSQKGAQYGQFMDMVKSEQAYNDAKLKVAVDEYNTLEQSLEKTIDSIRTETNAWYKENSGTISDALEEMYGKVYDYKDTAEKKLKNDMDIYDWADKATKSITEQLGGGETEYSTKALSLTEITNLKEMYPGIGIDYGDSEKTVMDKRNAANAPEEYTDDELKQLAFQNFSTGQTLEDGISYLNNFAGIKNKERAKEILTQIYTAFGVQDEGIKQLARNSIKLKKPLNQLLLEIDAGSLKNTDGTPVQIIDKNKAKEIITQVYNNAKIQGEITNKALGSVITQNPLVNPSINPIIGAISNFLFKK